MNCTPFSFLTMAALRGQIEHLRTRGMTMPADRELLKRALSELVRLQTGAENPRRFLAQLYDCALTEWAEQLGVDQSKLNKLVHVRGAVSNRWSH
jgi:hypothetical protein